MDPTEGKGPGKARVLIVTATDRRRGAEVFTVRLGQGLAARGWEVQTVSLTSSGDLHRVEVEPLTDVPSARPGRFNRRIASALTRRIRSFAPDVVLANGGATLRYGALATLRTRAPLVYIAIGEPGYWLRSAAARAANRWMLGRTAMILAVSEATRAQLLELSPSLAGRAHVTYTGVPDELFEAKGDQSDGPLRVVMVGSLSDEKDPLLAVRTVARVHGVRLRLVGGGPLEARVQEEIEGLGIGDRVELVGVADDVTSHFEWANVLMLTSRTEGLPGAILEAGAASVPAVAVDVGGVREAVSHGLTGFVVDREGGIDALAGVLSKLATDPDTVRRMGRAARLHIKERFALDPIVAGYAARLTEVLR